MIIPKFCKKVMVIAAHPDDEILGCGATMKRLTNQGHSVKTLLLGKGRPGEEPSPVKANEIVGVTDIIQKEFPDNKFDSVPLLDIVQSIENDILSFSPDIVFTHHYNDLNVDHRITFEAVLTVCRPQKTKTGIYLFFIPSSTDYSGKEFNPIVFSDVKSTIQYKLKALEYYQSELKEYPHSRSLESVTNISKYWGNRIGLEYVEPFVLYRGYI